MAMSKKVVPRASHHAVRQRAVHGVQKVARRRARRAPCVMVLALPPPYVICDAVSGAVVFQQFISGKNFPEYASYRQTNTGSMSNGKQAGKQIQCTAGNNACRRRRLRRPVVRRTPWRRNARRTSTVR